MYTISKIMLVAAGALLIGGCAATAVRKDAVDAKLTAGVLKVKAVEVRASPKAKEQLPENIKFDLKGFAGTVEHALSSSGLQEVGAANSLDIEVTNVYIRGTFSAVMLGVFAGVDNVTGNVRVLDPAGKALRSFEISAGYGLGGWAGGQDSMRINYLYERFAELTRDQLRDQK